tara:strand:- start:3255 stop:3707 length:453 start_codon:yes stop_codon:yes gene_type:complete
MSIPRRRRRSIRTVIADLQSAIADLDARVDALEEEDEWLLEAPTGTTFTQPDTTVDGGQSIGVGSTAPTVTIPAATLVNLIQAQPINTSMSDNVGIGSSAPPVGVGSTSDGVGVGSTAPTGTTFTQPDTTVDGGQVGIGSTTDVGIGTSS